MKESETDKILFSNISYLKQFRLNKMGAEVVISDKFLISKFLKGLTHCAVEKSPTNATNAVTASFQISALRKRRLNIGDHSPDDSSETV